MQKTYKKGNTEFMVIRTKNDIYGNPLYQVAPIGFVTELPKIGMGRRNNSKRYYTIQSYNIDETMEYVFNAIDGKKMYHNMECRTKEETKFDGTKRVFKMETENFF